MIFAFGRHIPDALLLIAPSMYAARNASVLLGIQNGESYEAKALVCHTYLQLWVVRERKGHVDVHHDL